MAADNIFNWHYLLDHRPQMDLWSQNIQLEAEQLVSRLADPCQSIFVPAFCLLASTFLRLIYP